jgi:hypothetical protein
MSSAKDKNNLSSVAGEADDNSVTQVFEVDADNLFTQVQESEYNQARNQARAEGRIYEASKKRLHSLDAFRAMLAIFGVILHAYYFHLIFTLHQGTFDSMIMNTQAKGADFFGILSLWIHSFRMPAFFAISGFFSFYLLNRIGHGNTVLNRCKRILIPFLILWLAPLAFSAIELLVAHAGRAAFYQDFNYNVLTYVGTFWFLYFLLIMDALLLLVFVPLFKREPVKNVRLPQPPSSRGGGAGHHEKIF